MGGEKSIDEYAAATPETIQCGSNSEGYGGSNAARWPVIIAENKHGWLCCNQWWERERLDGLKIKTSAGDVAASAGFYTY